MVRESFFGRKMSTAKTRTTTNLIFIFVLSNSLSTAPDSATLTRTIPTTI
jgi:hypothetical protein